jgi:hypothetical protein
LKQGDALLPLLFNFAVESATKRVQVNQDGLKLNGTHQFQVYADDVNILGGSGCTIKKNTEALVTSSKKFGRDVNADKSKHTVMPPDQNAGQSQRMKIGNSFFERVEQFKCLGTTLRNQNCIQEEIKSRLKSGNTYYHSMQNLASSSSLSKNIKIKIYITIILLVVLHGCETWSLTLREEHRLSVFDNSVQRRIFGVKRNEVTGEWRKLHEELNDLYSSPNIIWVIEWRRMRWAEHAASMGVRRSAYRVLVGKHEGKRPLGRPRHRWEDITMDLHMWDGGNGLD